MASYMFLFTLAMVLFLTDARPHNQEWSVIKKMKSMTDDDVLTEINRLLSEREHNERRLRSLSSYPEFASWTYQLKKFRQ